MTEQEMEAKLAEAQKAIEALSAKNRELLEEKRSTKSGAERQLMEAQDRIAALEADLSKAQGEAKKSGDKLAADLKAAQDLAASRLASLQSKVREDGLRQSLLESGVKNPAHLKAAIAMLKDSVQVDEEKLEAFVVAKGANGAETRKALAEFAKEWAAGDEGKAFVTVAGSSGGGSSGPGSINGAPDFSKMNPADAMAYAARGPAEKEAVAAYLSTRRP